MAQNSFRKRLDPGLDLETIFYAKALRDIRCMPRHKRKQLKLLARKWSSLRSLLPAVLPPDDLQLAHDVSQDTKLVDYVFQEHPEAGIEQFRVGDIVTCGEANDYAEVLRLVPATGKVHVAWLVLNDDESVDDPFCVHLPTGEHVRWQAYMLSNVRQPEDEAFHWEHVQKAKVEDVDIVPGKRYMVDIGIVDSHPGHDFEPLEDSLVESPSDIVGILRGNTGMARSIAALKAEWAETPARSTHAYPLFWKICPSLNPPIKLRHAPSKECACGATASRRSRVSTNT